jgi:hypothetical protein
MWKENIKKQMFIFGLYGHWKNRKKKKLKTQRPHVAVKNYSFPSSLPAPSPATHNDNDNKDSYVPSYTARVACPATLILKIRVLKNKGSWASYTFLKIRVAGRF